MQYIQPYKIITCEKDADNNEEIFGMISELKKYVKDSVEPLKKDIIEKIETENSDFKRDFASLIS